MRGNTKYHKLKFIKDSTKVHKNFYNYSEINYINNKIKIEIMCPKHGIFNQTPAAHRSGSGCFVCFSEKCSHTEKKVIQDFKKIHSDKYNYSKVKYSGNLNKVEIICSQHGSFFQIPKSHKNGCGCPKCSENWIGDKNYILNQFHKIHNNKYDYSKMDYVNDRSQIIITCYKHGDFKQTPNNHKKGKGCQKCRHSKGELIIGEILESRKINYLTQHKFGGCFNKRKLKFDFYIPEKNLIIEYDGRQHFEFIEYWGGEEGFMKRKKLDGIKNKYCEDNNIKLIRIPYWEINNIENILINI